MLGIDGVPTIKNKSNDDVLEFTKSVEMTYLIY